MQKRPDWQLNDSKTHKAVLAPGDRTFNPPKRGMLVFDHAVPALRDYWKSVCINATATGFVDGCFSDSSQPNTHGTQGHLNAADEAAFEAGKVQTMSELTQFFGGTPGKPYAGSDGVLIGKTVTQEGINAVQIEMFKAGEAEILELMQGAKQGYLVQAHAAVTTTPSKAGCNDLEAMTDVIAAFLIGAGDDSYFGSGLWISPGIEDIEQRWCPELFERPIGAPLADAVKTGQVYHRAFATGTNVSFDVSTNKGTINWSG